MRTQTRRPKGDSVTPRRGDPPASRASGPGGSRLRGAWVLGFSPQGGESDFLLIQSRWSGGLCPGALWWWLGFVHALAPQRLAPLTAPWPGSHGLAHRLFAAHSSNVPGSSGAAAGSDQEGLRTSAGTRVSFLGGRG